MEQKKKKKSAEERVYIINTQETTMGHNIHVNREKGARIIAHHRITERDSDTFLLVFFIAGAE